RLSARGLFPLLVLTALLLGLAFAPAGDAAQRQKVVVKTVEVGAPGNPSIGVVPFSDAIYESCADAPSSEQGCQTIGGVDYRYAIGQLEVTNAQWVRFLNTIDPSGRKSRRMYARTQSSSRWPEYGSINHRKRARPGRHYSVSSKQWARKPYAFATFLSAARFANSLYNGRVLKKRTSAANGVKVTSYTVRLSRNSNRGMYNMKNRRTTRTAKRGFVVPSQDEWVKAAYFDPAGGGTYSYWKYPTNEGVFGDGTATAPNPTVLDFDSGKVTNGTDQPLAGFKPSSGPAPNWCPAAAQLTATTCSTTNPFKIPPSAYAKIYAGGVATVGGAGTPSPWGTLDQGGNAVEWTDTITLPPSKRTDGKGRVWRRLHGGISNSTAYQMWPSAVGLNPQDNFAFARTYPWLGIRIGVIGNLKVKG
ncbi:MAG: hypothetical protein WBW62_06415, partial [Solirubrobacterales bacterium]